MRSRPPPAAGHLYYGRYWQAGLCIQRHFQYLYENALVAPVASCSGFLRMVKDVDNSPEQREDRSEKRREKEKRRLDKKKKERGPRIIKITYCSFLGTLN